MSDYGLDEEDERKLLHYCKQMDVDDRVLLFNAAISSAPGLEVEIYYSIIHIHDRYGYGAMMRKGWYIPVKADDFYGYRRKTLVAFYNLLRMSGKIK